nr:MAG TPA: hypothetical protein [Inoviridae sp.]
MYFALYHLYLIIYFYPDLSIFDNLKSNNLFYMPY